MDITSAILSQVASSMDPMKQAEALIIKEHLTSMRTSTQSQKDQLTNGYRTQIKTLRDEIASLSSDGAEAHAKQIKSIEDEIDDIYEDIARVRNF